MKQVAVCADNALILRCIHRWLDVGLAQFESILHGCGRRAAGAQAALVEQLANVCGVVQIDPCLILHNFDVEIVREEHKTTHLEPFLHMSLEFIDAFIVGAGDNQIIDIDLDDQLVTTSAACVEPVLYSSGSQAWKACCQAWHSMPSAPDVARTMPCVGATLCLLPW
jgi:hypothetical protein